MFSNRFFLISTTVRTQLNSIQLTAGNGSAGDWNWSRARRGWFTSGREGGGLADGISGCEEESGPLFGRSARAAAT